MATYVNTIGSTLANVNRTGGYSTDVLFAPRASFTTFGALSAATTPGSSKTVTGDHVFPATQGFYKTRAKLHSVQLNSESQGDTGALGITHKFKLIVLGDNPTIQEQMEKMTTEDFVFLLKDASCEGQFKYVQLGCDCNGVNASSFKFDSKTTKEGVKEYELEFEVPHCKYFYTGAVTYAA